MTNKRTTKKAPAEVGATDPQKMRIKLKHVRKYDDGAADQHSFTLGSAKLSDESGRLMGDLALLTRPFGDVDGAVDFDVMERLANEALEIIIVRLDWMVSQLGLAESPDGELHWFPWFEDNGWTDQPFVDIRTP